MFNRHWLACPQFEGSRTLEEHHAQAVHRSTARFFRHFAKLGKARCIDDVHYVQFWMEIGFVGHHRLAFEWLHAYTRSVHEQVAVVHFLFQLLQICQIVESCLAAGLRIDLLHRFFSAVIEIILAVEDADL